MSGQDPRSHFPDVEKMQATAVATILDPRYKTVGFSKKEYAQSAKETLVQLVYKERMAAKQRAANSDTETTDSRQNRTNAEEKVRNNLCLYHKYSILFYNFILLEYEL